MSALAETATATRLTCECQESDGGGRLAGSLFVVARASQGGPRWCTGGEGGIAVVSGWLRRRGWMGGSRFQAVGLGRVCRVVSRVVQSGIER